jgi:hypothetical protein
MLTRTRKVAKPRTGRQKPRKAAPVWVGKRELADIFGITPAGMDKSRRPHFPKSAIRADGLRLKFNAARCVESWLESHPPRQPRDAITPALERYRLARARLAELELSDRKAALISLADAATIFRAWLGGVQQTADELDEAGDIESARVLATVARRIEADFTKRFSPGDAAGDPNPLRGVREANVTRAENRNRPSTPAKRDSAARARRARPGR